MTEFKDINLFRVGSIVDIDEIPEFQGMKIERIADAGVTISGNGRYDIVVSGKSPACIARPKISNTEDNNNNMNNNTDNNSVNKPASSRERGKYDAAMKNPVIPEGSFTIKQFAEINSLPIPYAMKWVKENCTVAGFVEKAAGQRGRAAQLYVKN